jgi:hypothetical protein
MNFRMQRSTSLATEVYDRNSCQFGITELFAAAAPEIIEGGAAACGGDILGALGSFFGFGGGEAAGAGAAATLPGADIASIIGSGEGLFGGTPGLAGTLLAGGSGLSLADLAGGTAGLGALGTAADFLAAPGASAFNPAALTPAFGAPGGGPGVLGSSVPTPSPTGIGGTSVFDTGTSGLPGVSSTGAPAATPAVTPPGASASSIAAPSGVAGSPDATAAGSSVFNTGTSAVPGSPGATPSPSIASLTGGAPAASTPTSSIDQLLNKMSPGNVANSAVDSLVKNPLGIALGAGGLGYSIYSGMQNTKNEQALTAQAKTATDNSTALEQQGQGLVNYLTTGTLPPGYQTQIDQAISSAIAKAKSDAAAQGLSTDPSQNSALQSKIEEIQNQQPILQEQLAAQLAGTGTSLINAGATSAGLSGSLYQALVQNDTTQAANAGKAIATLAAAMAGKSQATIGSTPITIG